jgi:hypothetical protein
MTDGERRCGSRQNCDDPQPLPRHDDEAGGDAAKQAAEPAHTTAAEEERGERLLAGVFERPQQLGTK